MGNMAGYRAAFIEAQDYIQQWDDYAKAAAKAGKDKKAEPAKAPKRDLRLETLAGAIKGDIQVHIHCYRADEMSNMIDLANRSEGHTSELQSLMRISYAVFCLKKKIKKRKQLKINHEIKKRTGLNSNSSHKMKMRK